MAVYTEVTAEDLYALLGRYDIGSLTAFKGIAEGVENSNFFLGTGSGQFILTVYEKRVSAEDLPFFLGLMEHLAQCGVRCPTPVHDREGRVLQRLAGKPAPSSHSSRDIPCRSRNRRIAAQSARCSPRSMKQV